MKIELTPIEYTLYLNAKEFNELKFAIYLMAQGTDYRPDKGVKEYAGKLYEQMNEVTTNG